MPSKCKTDGCKKQGPYGIKGGKAIACKTHSTKEMIDLVTKKCICGTSRPSYGLLTDERPTCCSKCSTPEMVNIVSKRCICKKSIPSFGLETDKVATCCKICKTLEMINIKDKKCVCGISVNPNFGLEGDKTPTCCSKCRSPEMIDIKHKRCLCGKVQPSFGLESDNKIICCDACKTPQMINLKDKDKICICGEHRPSFGFPNDIKATCCSLCLKPGMVDIVSKKCVCGLKGPTYGLITDKTANYCIECKTPEMIDIKNKRCNCGKVQPSFGLETDEKPSCCKSCKTPEMVNIITKRCIFEDCNTFISNKAYEGHCAYHYGNLFPDKPVARNFKTKERKVVDYIRTQYTNYTWKFDKIVEDGCSKRRPDIFLDLGYQVIIVEVDENQHRTYEDICENKRLMEISQDINHRPLIFIRFNPDKYLDKNNKTIPSCYSIDKQTGLVKINNNKKWNERLTLLKENIDYWLKNNTEKTVELVQLFYDSEEIEA